jgi:hypothetical protein
VTKYLSPTGQWLNSYWLAIMWNAWSFDIVKAKNDNVKWGIKFYLNGHSLIFARICSTQIGQHLYQVNIANHEMSWSEPQYLKIIVFLPCMSEHPYPECRKLSSSSERLKKQLSGRRSRTELVDKLSYYSDL